MATYTISSCTLADSDAITRNNIPACWEDPHYTLAWPHRTLEQHIAQVAKRTPRTLVNDRATKRHQKAIDPETGRLLGYARWHLPPSHATNADGTPTWLEAVGPAVGPEEEAEIRRIADTAIWDPKYDSDEFIALLRPIKNEIFGRKPYIRT
jgi:hypothetical protein